MNAGLSPRSRVRSRRNGVNATTGIVTGDSGARKIMAEWAVYYRIALPPFSLLRFAPLFVGDFAEGVEGMAAGEEPAVDEERRRPVDADPFAEGDVAIDIRGV